MHNRITRTNVIIKYVALEPDPIEVVSTVVNILYMVSGGLLTVPKNSCCIVFDGPGDNWSSPRVSNCPHDYVL